MFNGILKPRLRDDWSNMMPFRSVHGLKGKVYIPEQQESAPKKHPCQDCYACQMCGDERCNVCLRQKACRCENVSVKES
jgi:hypothetical protein